MCILTDCTSSFERVSVAGLIADVHINLAPITSASDTWVNEQLVIQLLSHNILICNADVSDSNYNDPSFRFNVLQLEWNGLATS